MPSLILHKTDLSCGLDEAGRGCLAGPVAAAAVILDNDNIPEGLNDSKKLSPNARTRLRLEIESTSLAWAVAMVDAPIIDEINILKASILAMHKAVEKLEIMPAFLLVDGNQFTPYPGIVHENVIKGDSKYLCIAAASILAKTHRDELMARIHSEYPHYEWSRNKGYPTPFHIQALTRHGPSPYHRKTFSVKQQTRLMI